MNRLADDPLFTARRANSQTTQRQKLPWPKGKPFKILSLDGGGIRGIFGASLLLEIERDFKLELGIADFFDLVAGTSTGGIMAIALGLGNSAEKIAKMYIEDGRKIFPPSKWYYPVNNSIYRFFKQFMWPIYSEKTLEDILIREFEDKKIGHSRCRLLIPAFMYPKSEIAVFKTDHHEIIKRDWKTPAWRAARATSAAPTYFPGMQDGEKVFADGGLWANNPVMLAVLEALSCFEINPSQIKVLSIGTGNPPVLLERKHAFRGMLAWRKAFELSSYLTTDNFAAQAEIVLGPQNVLRLNPEGSAVGIGIDDWVAAKSALPTEARRSFNENREHIKSFFEVAAEPWTRHYSHHFVG